MTILQDIGKICADGINRVLSRVITLEGRVTSAEANLSLLGAQVPPPTGGFTIETVNWTNLSEINLSGEKLLNTSFDPPPLGLGVDVEVIVQWINGGKTASVGQIYTIDLVQSTGGMRLTGNGQSLFASASQLTTNVVALHPWELNSSYTFPTGSNPPPNGWGWEEFVVDVQVKWIGASTANHTQGSVYQANAYRPAWDNYVGNIRIKNDSDNYGWVGNDRGVDWEVVQNAPANWAVASGTLDTTELATGVIAQVDATDVKINQMFSTPLSIGDEVVVKLSRTDSDNNYVSFRQLKANGYTEGNDVQIPASAEQVTHIVATSDMYGIQFNTRATGRKISEVSVFKGAVSGGSVQASGGGLYKISGPSGYNAGASSVQSIGGNTNGYFQFQIAHQSHSAKIGLVYSDHDYSVDQPYLMNFGGGNIDLYNPWINDHTPFVAGDWIRIRHYALDNEIHFQKRQEVFDNGVSLGEDYVTFYTHPVSTTGQDLFLDTSFHFIGAGMNDVQIATT